MWGEAADSQVARCGMAALGKAPGAQGFLTGLLTGEVEGASTHKLNLLKPDHVRAECGEAWKTTHWRRHCVGEDA